MPHLGPIVSSPWQQHRCRPHLAKWAWRFRGADRIAPAISRALYSRPADMNDTTATTIAPAPRADKSLRRQSQSRVALPMSERWNEIVSFLASVAQLALLVFVVKIYRIEARTFRVTFAIVCCGFVIHHFLPRRLKLPFF